jgi:hypothetical protein
MPPKREKCGKFLTIHDHGPLCQKCAAADTLKPCPFCGPECSDTNGATAWCLRCGIVLSIHHWQSRPVEDELREQLRAGAYVTGKLMDQARQAEQEARDARARVAELEASHE